MGYLKNNVKIKELTLNIVGVCKIEEHLGFIKVTIVHIYMNNVSLSLGSPQDFPVLHEGHEIVRGLPIDDRMSQNSNIYKLYIKVP